MLVTRSVAHVLNAHNYHEKCALSQPSRGAPTTNTASTATYNRQQPPSHPSYAIQCNATMTDDDEFGDEIDWSTVQLPSISASMAVPRATTSNNNFMTMPAAAGARHPHSSGSVTAAATAYPHSGYPPRNDGAMAGQMAMGSMGAASNLSSANNADALRRQVR